MNQTQAPNGQLNNPSAQQPTQPQPTEGTGTGNELQFYVFPEHVRRCSDPQESAGYVQCSPIGWQDIFKEVKIPSAFTVYRVIQEMEYEGQAVEMSIPFPQAEKTLPDKLSALREQGTKCRLECYLAAIDVDNPGHGLHSQQSLEQCVQGISDLSSCPIGATEDSPGHVGAPHFWYITQHGFRLIYVLAAPIVIDSSRNHEFSSRMRTLKKGFQEHFDKYITGLDVDEGITQWHRVYRVPNCPRKDSSLTPNGQWWYRFGHDSNAPMLNLWDFRQSFKQSDSITIEKTDAPDPHDCYALIQNYQEGNNNVRNTVIGRIMASRLAGSEAYQAAFNPQYTIATERNNTLFRLASQSVNKLFGKATGLTKEHVFGVAGVHAYELGDDDDGIPWTEKYWDMICRMWAEKEAQASVIELKRQELSEINDDVLSSMQYGVAKWSPKPFSSPEEAKEFIKSHLFCCVGNSFFPLGDNGFYEEIPLTKSTMRAIFKNRPIGQAVATVSDKGNVEYPNTETIMSEHCTIASHIHYQPSIAGSKIVNVDQTAATLEMRTYRLDPELEGEFNPDVDAWLQAMFGEYYELACRWIAYSLDFSNPICVLSIQSEPGAGKKLLVQGLAECLEVPNYCTGDEVLGVFNDSLALTPWVWIDEGWPDKSAQSKAASDVIRRWTGGGAIPVKKMYCGQVKVTNPCRFIFTANNEEVVRELSRGKILSPEDRQALEQRVLHLRLGDGGRRFLEDRGGRALTAGWIDKDGSDETGSLKGNRTVAKHFKFLYDNRYSLGAPGPRYLVSGLELPHNPVVNCLLSGGATPLVLEAIYGVLTKIERRIMADTTVSAGLIRDEGIDINVLQGKVAITPRKLQEEFRSDISTLEKKGISIDDCVNVLNNFSYGRENSGYYLIDCKLLNNNLTKKGMCCKLIETVADIQEQLGLTKVKHNVPRVPSSQDRQLAS